MRISDWSSDVCSSDLVDALDLEGAALPHRLGRLLGDDAELGLRVAGMRLDLETDAEPVLRLPDGGHLGAAVARNHAGISCKPKEGRASPVHAPGVRVGNAGAASSRKYWQNVETRKK